MFLFFVFERNATSFLPSPPPLRATGSWVWDEAEAQLEEGGEEGGGEEKKEEKEEEIFGGGRSKAQVTFEKADA